MLTIRSRHALAAVTAAVALPLALTACGMNDSGANDSAADGPSAGAASTPGGAGENTPGGAGEKAAADGPFGPACASVPKDGAGSFDGMAKDPVATAASNNPALSTLVTAVKKAGLVDTLNNAQNITVFAPTNDAFAKIPKAELDKVLNDKATLTKVLTYHVVGQKLTPQQLENGSFETLEKGTVTTSGSGEAYKVNGTANVVCGNVPTANATVYIVDSVLMPPM
ncbi:fasciclin domain-containing protein [Streptomyces sp. NPDC015131]|uniref:fasciclin domain-containing protein n=1 Tax=Streptomyces sp. NPDC015131 TaxID=3364941 RepID=UPI0036FE3264